MAKKSKENKFTIAELREHSKQLFDVPPEVFDGAFFNEKADEKFTREEAAKKIQQFQKTVIVKEKGGK